MAVQKLTGFIKKTNDNKETFEQCEEKIDTKYSINLPTRYQYKHKVRNGWINIVNPFRGTLVLGTPGSGKSYSVYTPFMEQMIKKGYTMFVYDFKYPALTDDVFNIFMQNLDAYGKQGIRKPTFCVVRIVKEPSVAQSQEKTYNRRMGEPETFPQRIGKIVQVYQ